MGRSRTAALPPAIDVRGTRATHIEFRRDDGTKGLVVASSTRSKWKPSGSKVWRSTGPFSSASLWEATIKVGLGKLPLDPQRLADQLQRTGVRPLAVTWQHALAVHRLPPLHKDPFDRLLVAQAMAEPLHLLTHDATLVPYSELVILV